ncbi:MAG TPA: DASS family sodium-coupled anion symporter [Bryobacteraceae bacterium]|nr:DASS family sodium-coupled anion symporter [Bryobacteraceae bacterium]
MSCLDSTTSTTQAALAPSPTSPDVRRRVISTLVLVALYLAIEFLLPRPASVTPAGWRLLGIFVAAIGALMLRPIPGGAAVLIAVVLASIFGGLTIQQALGGYGDPTVWLVMAAFSISTALIKTGLARRIALVFIRAVGQTSLGVCYALSATDMVLASVIPSNGARSGGVVLPIVRSVAELYGSLPGPSAALVGSFLVTGVYQGICITAAMFFTGQASNPLAAKMATEMFHYPVTWALWLAAGIVPGLCSLAIVPWIVYRMDPPVIRKTPEAAAFAADELVRMGPVSSGQKIVSVIFVSVCALWITSPLHHLDITVTALLGSATLLLTGVLTWNDVVSDRAAWDIFIWYGGLLQLGKSLNDAGVTREFARHVGAMFGAASWIAVLAGALGIYFYAHYGFASITAHMLAMFPPFAAVLVARGAPAGLVIFSFACFANLAAGLTNYGTTPSPMFYAHGYVSFQKWWRVGFVVSLVNLAIWSTIGFAWWKLIGIW